MNNRDDLLRPDAGGLYCEAGGFWIDPLKPVGRAIIIHGNGEALAGYLSKARCFIKSILRFPQPACRVTCSRWRGFGRSGEGAQTVFAKRGDDLVLPVFGCFTGGFDGLDERAWNLYPITFDRVLDMPAHRRRIR